MKRQILAASILLISSSCQMAGKHKDDSNQPNGANDQNAQAVQSSIQTGAWPKPLATLADMGDETQDVGDSSKLTSWLNDDDHFYVWTKSGSSSSSSSSSGSTSQIFSDAYNCTFAHYKATIQAKGEMLAFVISIDANSCLDSYKKAGDEMASSMSVLGDSSNNVTSVSVAFEFPLTGRGYRAMQCPGADMSSLNGQVITNINDLDTSSTTNPTMLMIRKSCTHQDNWAQPKSWQSSVVGTSYRIWVRKDNKNNSYRTEKTRAWKNGTMSSSAGPCVATANGGDITIADCAIFSSTKITQTSGNDNGLDTSGSPNHDVIRATTLKRTGGQYYNAGTVAFEKGNWKGSLTYTSSTSAPSWTATDNTGKSANGTISGGNTGSQGFNLSSGSVTNVSAPSWFFN